MPHRISRALCAAVLAIAPVVAFSGDLTHNEEYRTNAANQCQAFTPGISNTIRNRAAGIENVGTEPIAVACSFEQPRWSTDITISGPLSTLSVSFFNPTPQAVTLTCTLLVGTWNNVTLTVTKSITLASGSGNTPIDFSGTDLALTHLQPANVNCTLPPNIILARTTRTRPVNN